MLNYGKSVENKSVLMLFQKLSIQFRIVLILINVLSP